MPLDSLNDPKQLFSEYSNWGSWHYECKMQDESELDYVFEMLKQAYDLANKN